MNQEEIKRLFMSGQDCSQVVAGHFAETCGTDQDMMRKAAAAFGGGMQCGETCGAVTGALIVLGMKYGSAKEGDMEQKNKLLKKIGEFRQAFGCKYSSCICRDLLGYDVGNPEEFQMVLEEGLMFSFCPVLVDDTIQILERIL